MEILGFRSQNFGAGGGCLLISSANIIVRYLLSEVATLWKSTYCSIAEVE